VGAHSETLEAAIQIETPPDRPVVVRANRSEETGDGDYRRHHGCYVANRHGAEDDPSVRRHLAGAIVARYERDKH
jgi:hypothetical protein